jgi:hypothetical protein
MSTNYYAKWLFFIVLFLLSDIIASPLQVAAIDIILIPEKKQTSSNNYKDNNQKKQTGSYGSSRSIVKQEKNIKAVQGYRTTVDRKGRKTTEYVHGEVEKGKNGIYTGYLYGKKNKKNFIYGDPSRGTMQADDSGDFQIESAKEPTDVRQR